MQISCKTICMRIRGTEKQHVQMSTSHAASPYLARLRCLVRKL